MARRNFKDGTVALEGFGSSVCTSGGTTTLTPTVGWFKGKVRKADAYGERFASSEDAWARMRERGYSQPHRRSREYRYWRINHYAKFGMSWFRGKDSSGRVVGGAFPAIPTDELRAKCACYGPCLPLGQRERREYVHLNPQRRDEVYGAWN